MKRLYKHLTIALILAIALAIIHFLFHKYGGNSFQVTFVMLAISFFALFGIMRYGGGK